MILAVVVGGFAEIVAEGSFGTVDGWARDKMFGDDGWRAAIFSKWSLGDRSVMGITREWGLGDKLEGNEDVGTAGVV